MGFSICMSFTFILWYFWFLFFACILYIFFSIVLFFVLVQNSIFHLDLWFCSQSSSCSGCDAFSVVFPSLGPPRFWLKTIDEMHRKEFITLIFVCCIRFQKSKKKKQQIANYLTRSLFSFFCPSLTVNNISEFNH